MDLSLPAFLITLFKILIVILHFMQDYTPYGCASVRGMAIL